MIVVCSALLPVMRKGLVLLPVADAPGVCDGVKLLLLRGGSKDVFSVHLVRLVISPFCERGIIWIFPWDVFPGPSLLVAPAPDLWVAGSEEGGVLGVFPSSLAWMLLMCPRDSRSVNERSMALALAVNPRMELVGSKMGFSKLGGGARRLVGVL